jgi:hypothetical protein
VDVLSEYIACILKTHSHSKSGGSIWASLKCQCCFWIAGGLVSYLTMWLLTIPLFKNSTDTQGKLKLNLHSLSVSVSELLENTGVSLVPYYVTTHPPAIFENSIDTQGKLKLNLHSLSVSVCEWSFRIQALVSFLTMWLLTLQLFKNSNDTQGKLKLNHHSLSLSVSELLEYRR